MPGPRLTSIGIANQKSNFDTTPQSVNVPQSPQRSSQQLLVPVGQCDGQFIVRPVAPNMMQVNSKQEVFKYIELYDLK